MLIKTEFTDFSVIRGNSGTKLGEQRFGLLAIAQLVMDSSFLEIDKTNLKESTNQKMAHFLL